MTTLSTYLSISNNMSRWLSATAKSPAVSVATKYFEDNIGKVKSANDLVSNPRLFNYAMTAFGLGDMTNARGLMKQVLAQGRLYDGYAEEMQQVHRENALELDSIVARNGWPTVALVGLEGTRAAWLNTPFALPNFSVNF